MKYVKLFEEFNQEDPDTQNGESPSQCYIYHINKSGGKDYSADVRDQDGKVIMELDSAAISNDTPMKDENDIPGLIDLLKSKNKIKEGDTVVPAKQFRAKMEQDEFQKSADTNPEDTIPASPLKKETTE